MPRYYFGYEGEAPETEGENLVDDDAARAVAAVVAEEMGRGRTVRPRISIFNESGDKVDPGGGLIIEFGLPKTHY